MNEEKLNTLTNFSRRNFIKTSSAASAGILLTGNPFLKHENSNTKKRIAIVGVGVRSRMYEGALLSQYKDFYELVGLCDVNVGRFSLSRRWSAGRGRKPGRSF